MLFRDNRDLNAIVSWEPPQCVDPELKARTFEQDVAYLRLKDGLVSAIGNNKSYMCFALLFLFVLYYSAVVLNFLSCITNCFGEKYDVLIYSIIVDVLIYI